MTFVKIYNNPPSQTETHVRWMIRVDMPDVLTIEQKSFGRYAWEEEDFLKCLRQRNCIGMVAEQGEKIVGFMIYELHRGRMHVLNLAVHPSHRRCGVGNQMVNLLLGKLSTHRRNRLTVILRETNLHAQLFFREVGFKATKTLREHFTDSGEDAIVMQYRLMRSNDR